MSLRLVGFAALLAFSYCLAPASFSEESPSTTWQVNSLESAGFDPALTSKALEMIKAEEPDIHGILLIADGKIILDATYWPYDGREPHNLASVTKSVMTTLIAIADAQGILDLDQPMLDFFGDRDIANMDDRKQRITIRHLTGMTSGLACFGENDEPTLHEMNASPDWVRFTLDLPMATEPGTVFSYCSPGMHLLSAILQQAAGQTALAFSKENLFGPLGIDEVYWPSDPQGVSHGWGDLRLFPEDAAKFGQLWLDGGLWEGKRIVSEEWVRESSRRQITTSEYWDADYGYGWWIMADEDIPYFAASGRGGQRVSVYPSLGFVVVTVGGGIDPGHALGVLATALVSPGKALPDEPKGQQALKETLANLAQPPQPGPTAELPPLAAEVSGRTWVFAPNPIGFASLRVSFDGTTDAGVWMTYESMPPREGRIGLDGVLRFFPGEDGVKAGMRGTWISGQDFVAEYDGIAQIDAFDLVLHFDGDRLVMEAKDRTYEAGLIIDGRLE